MSSDSIKRRREERLRQLREQMRSRIPDEDAGDFRYEPVAMERPSREEEWDDEPWLGNDSAEVKTGSSFLIKALLSLFILSFTFVVYKVPLPFSGQAQALISEVMTREYNFAGAMAKMEGVLGQRPDILPVFKRAEKDSQQVWNPMSEGGFQVPVKGQITEPFPLNGKGVQIAAADSSIKAIDKGWVIFVGTKEGLGQTVIIQHTNNTKSWYSGVDKIQVAEHDWVEPGQVIAEAAAGKTISFAMQKDDQYIDPTSVIPFE